ncbi:predicted protein [Nematostella vectensis]|uniref:Ig-like domain-containing protein n=1 Tax=Nematostella vectensis TaxID=45351 RepID=A7S2V7_NEMVE|nr:predicted protein [Nematostella vectensis]|eukprot:XP_001634020.1 predicted protein [Nematostella vectensis]
MLGITVLLSLLFSSHRGSVLGKVKDERVAFCPRGTFRLNCPIWKEDSTRVWIYIGIRGVRKLASIEKNTVNTYPNLSKTFGKRASILNEGTLVIKDALTSDKGKYVCENDFNKRVSYNVEMDCGGQVTREMMKVCPPSTVEGCLTVPCDAVERVQQGNVLEVVWKLNGRMLVLLTNEGHKKYPIFKGLARIDSQTKTLTLNTSEEHFTRLFNDYPREELNMTCVVHKVNGGTAERHLVTIKPTTCISTIPVINSTLTLRCPVVPNDVVKESTRKAVWEVNGNNNSNTHQRVIVTRLRDKVNVSPDLGDVLSVTPEFSLSFKRLRDIAGIYFCKITDLEGMVVGQTYTVTVTQPNSPSEESLERQRDTQSVSLIAFVAASALCLLELGVIAVFSWYFPRRQERCVSPRPSPCIAHTSPNNRIKFDCRQQISTSTTVSEPYQ